MKAITLEDLFEKSQNLNKGELILDVRSAEEYEEGYIKSARHIPHTEVANFAEELKNYQQIYIYCRRGGRAHAAACTLDSCGLNNLSYVGTEGTDHWSMKGYPLVKNS